ncbi:TetR/AcrR family transcriptional regulator [Paroceanicella profunda]|uniref:TetR/AcrR family transcriptional regulator n=1 Tax=Paroceanicella profunda TaxID=2579971 RepID=UPI00197D3E5C|nr:TetR/AcrR family transcriptional regulator [Paroceanicella profunda]
MSNRQAQENRNRVIDVAAARIRERGIDGTGIADLMKAAGLTHGGFYKQFRSKDDLVLQAVSRAIDSATAEIDARISGADDPLAALVRFYVSPEHRDAPARGCSLASLATDTARSDDPALRALMGDLVARYLSLLTSLADDASDDPRRQAISTLAGMIGALVLSRAVPDPALSDEILQVVAEDLSHGREG